MSPSAIATAAEINTAHTVGTGPDRWMNVGPVREVEVNPNQPATPSIRESGFGNGGIMSSPVRRPA